MKRLNDMKAIRLEKELQAKIQQSALCNVEKMLIQDSNRELASTAIPKQERLYQRIAKNQQQEIEEEG